MTCAKKLGKSNEDFIKIWYKCNNYGSVFGIKNDATFWAVYNGHLECLKYCTENGYTKSNSATWEAAEKGDLECLKYCTENGYKKNEYAYRNASTQEIKNYLKSNGYTCEY